MDFIVFYGWIIAVVLWALTLIFYKRSKKLDLNFLSKEIYWIVEQIDSQTEGAIKGDAKWFVFKLILTFVARTLLKVAPESAEKVGREVVETLSKENKS